MFFGTYRSTFVILVLGTMALTAGSLIRGVRLHSWGSLVSDLVRLIVLSGFVYLLSRTRINASGPSNDSSAIGIIGILLVNVLAYLGVLISR